jgi:long-chain acyl-CoA synthetase
MPLQKAGGPNMTALSDVLRLNRVIFRDQVFTKEYLVKAIDACARHLDGSIRSNSPVVYLVAPNHLKTIIGFLAIIKTGRAALLVDPKVGKIEFGEMLADTTPSAILRIDRQTIEFDYGKEVELTGFSMDPSLVAQLDDVAVMLYTAAEDGYAKAAMLTHRNLLSNAQVICEDNHIDALSTSCALLPFHHIFGLQYGVITPFIGNGTILVVDINRFGKTSAFGEELFRYRATHVYSIPLMFYLLGKSPRMGDIARHGVSFICGGYKLPFSLKSRFERKCGVPLVEGYGLTETSAGCLWQQRDGQETNDSIGRPVRGYTVKIFDDSDKELPPGNKGEIYVRGPGVTKGYFRHPEAAGGKNINGWLHTGDYGRQDAQGNVYFLGLKKKMFNVGGNKVYPEELRRLLMTSGRIEACEIWSNYNEMSGDRIKAKIKFKNGFKNDAGGFTGWCAGRLTNYKIPNEFLFV